MTVQDHKTVLYRQEDGSWVAEIPRYQVATRLMPSGKKLLAELAASLK